MAKAPGAKERQRLAELEAYGRRLQHAHGLVERFATDNANPDQWIGPLRRVFTQLKGEFALAGLDSMSQACSALDLVARRGGGRILKIRVLREGVASLRSHLETQERLARASASRTERDEKADTEAG
jgi:hypothetical protein